MFDLSAVGKIDIHAHATMYPGVVPPFAGLKEGMISKDKLIQIYDKIGVECGTLLPLVEMSALPMLLTNEDCKIMAEGSDGRFKWFCNVSPNALSNSEKTDLSPMINHYKALGAKGVGEITAQLYADDPKMDNLFYHCAQCDMPVIIHIAPHFGGTYGIVDELHLPRIEKMLKKHKKLKLIGHSQAFWSEICDDVTQESRNSYPKGKVREGIVPKLMREYDNLYCDLSAGSGANAMMRDREYAARFMEEFADRIYYGCDICTTLTAFQYEFSDFLINMVEDGYLTKENYIKIVRNNGAKLLGVEEYKEV